MSIYYPDASVFFSEIEEIKRTAGILVNAPEPPPLRSVARYSLTVEGAPQTVEFDAEVVFGRPGLTGLQILAMEETAPALEALCATFLIPVQSDPPPEQPAHQDAAESTQTEPEPSSATAPSEPELSSATAPSEPEPAPVLAAPVPKRPRQAPPPAVDLGGRLVPLLSLQGLLAAPAALHPDAELSPAEVILAAARAGHECTLHLGDWLLQFGRRGQITGFVPPDGDSILAELRRLHQMQHDAADALISEGQGTPGRAESLALSRGLTTQAKLNLGLRKLVIRRAADLVKLTDGPFLLRSGAETPVVAVTSFLAVGREIVRQTIRTLSPAALCDCFTAYQAVAPVLAEGAAEKIATLSLIPRDERFLKNLDGLLPLHELLQQAPMGKETVYELLASLMVVGLCRMQTPAREAAQTPEDELQEWLKRLAGTGPFDVLELHWTVHPAEIEARIRERRQELAPGGRLARFSPQAQALAQRLLQLMEKAYAELKVPRARLLARKAAAVQTNILMVIEVLQQHAKLAQVRKDDEALSRLHEMIVEIQSMIAEPA